MENKLVKNMEYWKKKNNIPGIEGCAKSGLTDGRAGSAPFQMATPGSSPNKSFLQSAGKFLNPMTGGPIGAGIRALAPNSKIAQGLTDPLGFGGGGGAGAMFGGGVGGAAGGFGAAGGVAGGAMAQQAAVPVQTPMMMKSPMKQEEERIYISGAYEVGDMVSEDDLEGAFKREGGDPNDYPQYSVQDYSEIKQDENGMYVIHQSEGPNQVDPDAPMKQEDGRVETIAGQDIIKGEGKDEGNFYYETIDGEQIFIEDPDGVVAKNVTDGMVSDLDFSFEKTEDGYYKVTGVAGEGGEQQASPEDSTPQGPMVPGGMGMPEGGM